MKDRSLYEDVSVTLWGEDEAPNGLEPFLDSEFENYSKPFISERHRVMDYNVRLAIEKGDVVYDLIGEEEITEENIRSLLE